MKTESEQATGLAAFFSDSVIFSTKFGLSRFCHFFFFYTKALGNITGNRRVFVCAPVSSKLPAELCPGIALAWGQFGGGAPTLGGVIHGKP